MEAALPLPSPKEVALDRFRKPPLRLNCAQSVMAAFSQELGHRSSSVGAPDVEALAGAGGGRAEGGVCGALYSSGLLVRDPAARARIEERFLAAAGSIHCKEIRKLGKLSCHNCVGTACELVSEELARVG